MKLIIKILPVLIFLFLVSVREISAACNTPNGTPDPAKVQTAIGCIPTQPDLLASRIITIATGVGSGIAFLFLLTGAFKLITSGGDPDSVQGAKETITSAIAGLLLIVFSVVILQVVGVQLLGLPGFNRTGSQLEVPGGP